MQLPAILAANDEYCRNGSAPAPRDAPPARRLAVLTCMDARIDLLPALGLEIGDAHVVRNAGGRASGDAIRSLVVSCHLLGTREIGVLHHTRCGLEGRTDDDIAAAIEASLGRPAPAMAYLPFDELDPSVVADVDAILASDALHDETVVWGGVYDVDTGAVRIVVEPRQVGGRAA